MATALVTQIAYAVQTLFDPAGTVGRLVDLGKLANYGLLTSFTPAYLFTAGINGTWYDPSDINLTWRRNLLTYTEQFDNAAWTKSGGTVVTNSTVAPDGTLTADTVTLPTGGAGSQLYSSVPITSGPVTVSVYLKASAPVSLSFGFYDGAIDVTIVNVTTFWQRFTLTRTAGLTSADRRPCWIYNGIAGSVTFDIWGAQLELGSTATEYQRITDGIQDYLTYQPLPVLYQDAAGTTPVTAVEQPVGLMLDKSKGLVLGPELVTNGAFASSLLGWSQSTDNYWTFAAGRAYHANSQNYNELSQTFTAIQKPVRIEFDYECLTASNTAQWFYTNAAGVVKSFDSAGIPRLQNGVGKMTYIAIDGIQKIGFSRYNQAEFYVDNISVRELPGNHAFNSSGNSANFPVLSARYNLLTKTEQFDDAVWNLQSATVTANAALSPRGDMTADKIVSTGSSSAVYQAISFAAGIPVTISVSASPAELNWLVISVAAITTAGTVWIDVATGVIGTVSNPTAYVASISKEANGNCRCSITFTPTGADLSGYLFIGGRNSDNTTAATVGSGIYIWGADLRVANDGINLPSYQRVNTATDYDTVGFPLSLRFNGVNQWLQTNSIDFSATDKMTVFAGVRKLSDVVGADLDIIAELSTASEVSNGAFALIGSNGFGGSQKTAQFNSKGTALVTAESTSTNYAAPITYLLSSIGNISGDQAILRVNGTQVAMTTADQGTGNYGNYPLYIGAREGTSLWFNGRLYGMVIAGKQASAAEITATETFINQKTGAY